MSDKQTLYKCIDDCPILSSLPKSEKQKLAEICVFKKYKSGQIMFRQDTKADGFYIIASGLIKISRVGIEGKEQVLSMFGPGEMCGEVPVFQGASYPATATAESDIETLYLPGCDFLDLIEKNNHRSLELLAVFAMRLRKFVNLIDDLSLKEVSARLAKILIKRTQKENSCSIMLSQSKAFLASRIGTVSETLSRTFARMSSKGIIHVEGKKITILNLDLLSEIAQGKKI